MAESRMALLDFAAGLFNEVNLNNCLVIACQHILESNYFLFDYLFEKGLKPENTFLLGKCYSTNESVLQKFRKKGVRIHKGSTFYNSHVSFDEQFDESVVDFLREVKKEDLKNFEKIIILDDGGYLVYWANSILVDFDNLLAVEQTSSGYIKIKDLKLNFPVINVARSKAKLKFESPFIAEIIVKKLEERLLKLHLSPKNALIVGKGAIGENISVLLGKKLEVKHFDSEKSLSDFGQSEFVKLIKQFDLIIGCTGETSIGPEYFNLLKNGTILVSASSSDREFAASKLRKFAALTDNCHEDLNVNGLVLLNSGFPINFDGSVNSAPPEKIQLTRALMFSAVCLGVLKKYENGLIGLDEEVQENIITEFSKLRK